MAKAQLKLYSNTLLTSGCYLTAKDLLSLFCFIANMKYVTAFTCGRKHSVGMFVVWRRQ